MFGDAALDAIRYRGGAGGGGGLLFRSCFRYSFAGYPPGKAYIAKCPALGFGMAGAVCCAVGMVLCRFGDGLTGGGVPVFVPEGFDVVE